MAMAIATDNDTDILQLDVKTIYLQSSVEEDGYVKPIRGYESQGNAMNLYKLTTYMAYVDQANIVSEQLINRSGHRIRTDYVGRTRASMSTGQTKSCPCFSYMWRNN